MSKLLSTLLVYCKDIKIIYLIILACFSSATAKAQFYCKDSSRINRYINCGPNYQPVCGCDGKTYRNLCIASEHNGIMNYQNGICEPIDIDFYPNPVITFMNISVARKDEGGAQVVIYDLFGKVYYSQFFNRIQTVSYKIEMQDYPPGVYILVAYTTTYGTWRKFIKQPQS